MYKKTKVLIIIMNFPSALIQAGKYVTVSIVTARDSSQVILSVTPFIYSGRSAGQHEIIAKQHINLQKTVEQPELAC